MTSLWSTTAGCREICQEKTTLCDMKICMKSCAKTHYYGSLKIKQIYKESLTHAIEKRIAFLCNGFSISPTSTFSLDFIFALKHPCPSVTLCQAKGPSASTGMTQNFMCPITFMTCSRYRSLSSPITSTWPETSFSKHSPSTVWRLHTHK